MTTTSVKPQIPVRKAAAENRTMAADVLTASFFDDPVTEWLVPDRARRPAVLPPLFEGYLDAFLPHRETYWTGNGAGVALWLPPRRELLRPDQLDAFGLQIAAAAGPDAGRCFELSEFFDAHAPAEPHWHLQLLGVRPDHQGQGIGSALLADLLWRADRDGENAYLEATTPRNRILYERHGFECTGEIVLPDGPRLWQMWRSPRA